MESIIKHFSLKFNTIKQILIKLQPIDKTNSDVLLLDLNDLEIKFALITSPLQLRLLSDEIHRTSITSELNIELTNENILYDINNLFSSCINILYKNNINIRVNDMFKQPMVTKKKKKTSLHDLHIEIQHLIDLFPINNECLNNFDNYSTINYRICNICGDIMEINQIKSELICSTCAMIKPLIGTSYENTQFYLQDTKHQKSGTFNPNRHFYFWWTHILAREDESEIMKDVNDNLFDNLAHIIQRDKKVLRMLTLIDVRNMLRELKKTELNKNIPLILKKITGIGPPSIIEEIEIKVERIFSKVISVCENIKRSGRTNRNYYPYYIYKIIDVIIPKEDFENRRILYYIYIQSKDTVECDDLDWEQICESISELVYRPTDRLEYLLYQPN